MWLDWCWRAHLPKANRTILCLTVYNTIEGLIARRSRPQDLNGARIGTPFGSTAHYQALYLIEIFSLTGVTLLDMSPSRLRVAWDANEIDAAFIWGSTLTYMEERGGYYVITAATLSKWGKPTFEVLATCGARRLEQ